MVLFLLAGYFSAATVSNFDVEGEVAVAQVADQIRSKVQAPALGIIAVGDTADDRQFASAVQQRLNRSDYRIVTTVVGGPPEIGRALRKCGDDKQPLSWIIASAAAARWEVLDKQTASWAKSYPLLANAVVVAPHPYRWPQFLTRRNLLNVADQIAVIAIIAIGMTMVIITGGIDLSVGSLIALSAVVTALLVRDFGGGENASALAMASCAGAAILLAGLVGAGSGALVAYLAVPPFIVTLSTMLVARGLAYSISQGQSISSLPDGFTWLGRGSDLFGVPNAVVLMFLLYAIALVVMHRLRLGRYIYAVGSNREAARLSGLPVQRVLIIVYGWCGLLAGLGGVIVASQLKTGAPQTGEMKELYVIAAVVVGGASLAGGRGSILATLLGALVIAVIENGMNLTGVENYTQKIVLGLVILAAVLLDQWRARRAGM